MRIFRDDALLELYQERIECSLCGLIFWPDETVKSYIIDNICDDCNHILHGRIHYLKKSRGGKFCPISAKKQIFEYRAKQRYKDTYSGTMPYKEWKRRKHFVYNC